MLYIGQTHYLKIIQGELKTIEYPVSRTQALEALDHFINIGFDFWRSSRCHDET